MGQTSLKTGQVGRWGTTYMYIHISIYSFLHMFMRNSVITLLMHNVELIIPAHVNLDILKFFTMGVVYNVINWFGFLNLCHARLFPTPLTVTFIQNIFNTDRCIKKSPLVLDRKQEPMKGKTTPICKSISVFISLQSRL